MKPFDYSPMSGAAAMGGVNPVLAHHVHAAEAMDTTSPTNMGGNCVPRSPAIATKNTVSKKPTYPGTQNRPPHLQMNTS